MVSCTMIQFLIKRITDSFFSADIFLISAKMELLPGWIKIVSRMRVVMCDLYFINCGTWNIINVAVLQKEKE